VSKPYLKSLALLACLALLGASTGTSAQTPKPAREEVLTNDSVIQMTRAGLNPSLIVSKVRASHTAFDLSTAELVRLKRERVADEVIQAMMGSAGGSASPTPAAPAVVEEKHEPSRKLPDGITPPEEPGIYLVREADGQRQLVQVEPSVYSQSKTGGMFKSAMTYGIAKIKTKAVLASAHAKLTISEPRPVFYFNFEYRTSSLSGFGGGIFGPTTSPNEFVLLKMEAKQTSREVIIMQANAFGAQSGTMDKYAQAFDYEKLAPGIYRVTPRADLAPGEYCFAYATQIAAGFSKVFDFGIAQPR
jgi:hypothetical protein